MNNPSIPKSYRDMHGRPGNQLHLNVVVPISVASEVADLMPEDPELIRDIVDTVVQEKYTRRDQQGRPIGFVPEVWNRYGRPPYEEWEQTQQKIGQNPGFYFDNRLVNPPPTAGKRPEYPPFTKSKVMIKG